MGSEQAVPQKKNVVQTRNSGTQDSFSEFSSKSSFNFSLFLLWISAILSIAATAFFWVTDNGVQAKIKDKKGESDSIKSEILSSTYKDVEKQASDFKSSVTELKKVYKGRNFTSDFLAKLYTKIDNDVQITNISITSEGAISLTGASTSYRSVADQMVALKDWNQLSNIDLGTVSQNIDKDGKSSGVNFSITGAINKNVNTATSSSTSSVSGSSSSSGGASSSDSDTTSDGSSLSDQSSSGTGGTN